MPRDRDSRRGRRAAARLPLAAAGLLAAAWVLAALTFPAVTGAEEPGGRPDLQGVWKLDKDLSDDPAAVMQKAMRQRRSFDSGAPGLGMGRPGGGGFGSGTARPQGGWGGPGGRGSQGSGGSDDSARGAGADRSGRGEMGRRFDSLEIEPIEGGWSIQYADGAKQDLLADDQNHVIDAGRGQETVRAHWEGQTLVVVRKGDRREVTERYDVTDDGKLLQVQTTMAAGRGGKIQFRRLYRPAPSGDEPPPN